VPKPVSPLVGYNNNVRHKGRIFHVQTEDSGVQRPRIVTHLFADGGRILKSTRTDYSEHVGRDDVAQIVRRLMKEQHKAMFIALRDGQLDEVIEQLGEVEPAPLSKVPAPSSPPSEGRPSQPPARRKAMPTLPDLAVPQAVTVSAAPAAPPTQRRPGPTLDGLSLADVGAPPTAETSPVATAVARRAPSGHTPSYGTPAVEAPPATSRYGAPRPAAIFDTAARAESQSLFGSATISEQSLDEVILSYLAEDLESSPE
jgi:hypothetical protein